MRNARAILTIGWAFALAAGCETRPRAPVLSDDPVYQNDREGFRFLAPKGWSQSTRAEVPSGKLDTETPLVAYLPETDSASASFRVSLIDLPASADLGQHVARPSYGVDHWSQTGAPEEVAVGSTTGVRYTLRGHTQKEELIKEVVCLRRGERVYFFTAMYTSTDIEARDELRRVIKSIIWKD
jgi:hypothetical protein